MKNQLEEFDLIHDKIIGIINNNDLNTLLEYLNTFDYNNINRGIFRTILMTIKPLRNYEIIKDFWYEKKILFNESKNKL